MIEFILGILLSIPVLIVLIITALLFEHNEHDGWAIFFSIIIAVFALNMFSITSSAMFIGLASFIPIGIIWSFWRWRRHCSTQVAKVKKNPNYKSEAKAALDMTEQKFRIVSWIVNWPISMVESILSDIIDIIEKLVTTVFDKVYTRIAQRALNKINKL